MYEFTELNDKLGNGEIAFEIINGEPYVKVGADTPRPFKSGYAIPSYRIMNPSTGAENPGHGSFMFDVSNYKTLNLEIDYKNIKTLHSITVNGITYTSISNVPRQYDVSSLDQFSITYNALFYAIGFLEFKNINVF